jgi:hypothetical protein
MAAKPNLLGDAAAVLRRDNETADDAADLLVTPRAAAAVPETRRDEQAALLRPKPTAIPLRSTLTENFQP